MHRLSPKPHLLNFNRPSWLHSLHLRSIFYRWNSNFQRITVSNVDFFFSCFPRTFKRTRINPLFFTLAQYPRLRFLALLAIAFRDPHLLCPYEHQIILKKCPRLALRFSRLLRLSKIFFAQHSRSLFHSTSSSPQNKISN